MCESATLESHFSPFAQKNIQEEIYMAGAETHSLDPQSRMSNMHSILKLT